MRNEEIHVMIHIKNYNDLVYVLFQERFFFTLFSFEVLLVATVQQELKLFTTSKFSESLFHQFLFNFFL